QTARTALYPRLKRHRVFLALCQRLRRAESHLILRYGKPTLYRRNELEVRLDRGRNKGFVKSDLDRRTDRRLVDRAVALHSDPYLVAAHNDCADGGQQ